MNKKSVDVQHFGEFVLTKDGSIDFGEITDDIAREIKRQAGKIRLRVGIEEKNSRRNFGEKHIERLTRLEQLKSAGFSCARDLVEHVCEDFDEIYKNGMDLLLYKYGENDTMAYIELTPSENGDFYDVKTALPTRRSYIRHKSPIWKKQKCAEKK